MKFLRKIHICAFALLNFWQNFEKIAKHVPRIPFSLYDPVFTLHRPPEYSNQDPFEKSQIGLFFGGQ